MPCDLLMEMSVGSYKTTESICRVARCLGLIVELEQNFNNALGVNAQSGKHAVSTTKKDLLIILSQLMEKRVFKHIDQREHTTFKGVTEYDVDQKKFMELAKEHLKQLKDVLYCTRSP